MKFQTFCKRTAGAASLAVVLASGALAQQGSPTVTIDRSPRLMNVAGTNNLYCAGYVQTSPLSVPSGEGSDRASEIVGAYNEQDGWLRSEGNYLVINGGTNKGVRVGDLYSVVRPRGEVNSRWTNKGRLGFYVQELGVLEVVSVKPEVSWARLRTSCDSVISGDLLMPFQPRTSPVYESGPRINLFADPSGKATGRIFLARDLKEMLSRDNIVYVDLGSEDNVAVGDRLTIYRTLGKGNLFTNDWKESVSAREPNFQSDKYSGGDFSSQAPRRSGSEADGRLVSTEDTNKKRPDGVRKVVGEAVVLNVKERTATVVITRAAQEIHTGDRVEVQ
ncbi:MAG TPA: hypothetical protein VHL50_07970 [Pyrinomonadaceae bacterium]|nr:hypothetical protein [Pyrinomonadaceae bacterium]